MKRSQLALAAALVLASVTMAACTNDARAEASAAAEARKAVGDPNAEVSELRVAWSPQYQRVVCGHIRVGTEERRFISLLLSDKVTATDAMVETASWTEKEAFTEIQWRPLCGASD